MNKQSHAPGKGLGLPMTLGQAPPGALLGLPTEILTIILHYLPVPDVLRVRSVSNPSLVLDSRTDFFVYRTRPAGSWTLSFAIGPRYSTKSSYTVLIDTILRARHRRSWPRLRQHRIRQKPIRLLNTQLLRVPPYL
jgi:F-box domain